MSNYKSFTTISGLFWPTPLIFFTKLRLFLFKTTNRTSVLWNILNGLAKKWPEMVVKWFIVTHRLGESVFSSKKNWKFFFRKYFNLFVENPALVLLWRNVMTERTQKQMHVVQVSKPLVATPTLFHNVVKNFIELGFKPFYSPFSLLKTFGFFCDL